MRKKWLGLCLIWSMLLIFFPHQEALSAVLKVRGAKTLCTPLLKGAVRIRKERGVGVIVINKGGSEGGIKKVYFNKADLACVVRYLTDKEKRSLIQETLAFDYLVAAVKKSLPIDNLTKAQIKHIFSGSKTRWRELDPTFPDLPIEPILTRKKSGTNKNIQKFFLGKDVPFRKDSLFVNTMTSVPKLLSEMKGNGGITLISQSMLSEYGSTLKTVSLDGIAPTNENVRSGIYPYGRPVALVYKKTSKRKTVISMLIRYLQDPKVNFFAGKLLPNTPDSSSQTVGSLPK